MARLKPTIAFETGAAIAAGGGVDEAHAPRAETVLRLVDIAKRFGALSAIDGVSLEVPAGAIFGFLGLLLTTRLPARVSEPSEPSEAKPE